MIVLRQNFYSKDADLSDKSYVPYEEQKRRVSKANAVSAAGAGASALAGGSYYGIKHRAISRQAEAERRGAAKMADTSFRRGNSTWHGRLWGKLTGRTKKIERSLQDTINQINQSAKKKNKKAALVGLGIAGAGTVASLGAGAIMRRNKSKKQ